MGINRRHSRALWAGLFILFLTGCNSIWDRGSNTSPAVSGTGPLTAKAPIIRTPSGTSGTSLVSVVDPDAGKSHDFAITAAPTYGSATVDSTGLVTYTPATGFTGNDRLTVSVNNNDTPSKSATVTINVIVTNQAPAPTAQPIATNINTPATTQIDVNDPDAGQTYTFTINVGARRGQASVDDTGLVTYTPGVGFTGSDSFNVIVTDSGSPPGSGGVTIKVTIVNRAPAPTAPGITTASNAPGTSQIAVNDPDNGQGHTFLLTTTPGDGTATVTDAGLVTYTPNPGFSGADSLAVTVADTGTPQQSATVTIPVTVLPIALSMTANPNPVALGGFITYQLRVSNVGNMTLTNVVLQDTVPDINGYESTGAVTGGGTCPLPACPSGSVITWPDMALAAGQTTTVSFNVKVNTTDTTLVPDGTLIHNSATVTYADGSVTATTDVAAGDAAGLSMGLAANHDPAQPGDLVTYTVTVGNTAGQALPQSAAGALTATLPAGMSFVSASGGGTLVDGKVQWNLGSVAAGGSLRYTYTMAVDNTLVNGTLLKSQTQVLDDKTVMAQAVATAQVQATWPLMLSMTADTDPVPLMWPVTYTLQVKNVGATTLTGVALQDTLPDVHGYILITSISNSGTCSNGCGAADLISWPTFNLAPGQTHNETFVATVNTLNTMQVPFGTLIRNSATATIAAGSNSQTSDLVVKD